MNSSGRNQTNGFFSGTVGNVSMTYYNDGAIPFSYFGLGDQFDRFWTGGGKLFIHAKEATNQIEEENSVVTDGFNRIEVSFDQFTGYKPLLYEIAGIFGADIQDYDIYNVKDSMLLKISPSGVRGFDYNASEYRINYNFGPYAGVSLGVMGSLRNRKRDKYFAVQDIIHISRGNPIHPNRENNRISLGFNYNSQLWTEKQ